MLLKGYILGARKLNKKPVQKREKGGNSQGSINKGNSYIVIVWGGITRSRGTKYCGFPCGTICLTGVKFRIFGNYYLYLDDTLVNWLKLETITIGGLVLEQSPGEWKVLGLNPKWNLNSDILSIPLLTCEALHTNN